MYEPIHVHGMTKENLKIKGLYTNMLWTYHLFYLFNIVLSFYYVAGIQLSAKDRKMNKKHN